MLKTLLKKQLMEVFRSYYYNPKNNTARSKAGTVWMFVLFTFLMVAVLGGMFGFLGYVMCQPLAQVGVGWLYFVIFGLISILLGVFGSVFSTFSGLYLAKDNDLLLAMPIPVRDVILSRLLNVYLMGLLYVASVLLPAMIVYWIFGVCSVATVVGGIVLLLLVSVFVLLLSCLLGWVVAKLSLRLKNKSFLTVLIALVGIGLYYFLYFKAQELLRELVENAAQYGAQIKGSAYGLYLFGRVGEGDALAIGIYVAAVALLTALVWLILRKTFLSIATASTSAGKAVYHEKKTAQQSADAALLRKELARFTSSANYMLNCGIGLLFMLVGGVALLVYRRLTEAITGMLGADFAAVLLCALVCMLGSMNLISAPSVSLEGKSVWLPQSLPVSPWQVLRAKLRAHLLIVCVPAVFVAVCGAWVIPGSAAVKLLFEAVCLLYTLLLALWGLFLGVKMPNLTWTNEIFVLKQSGCVGFALLGSWVYWAALGGLYFLFGSMLSPALYLGIWAALTAAFDLALYLWLRTKGAARFATL